MSVIFAMLLASVVQSLILQSQRLPVVNNAQMFSTSQTFAEVIHSSEIANQSDEPFQDENTFWASNFLIQGKKVTKRSVYEGIFQITCINPLPKFSINIFRVLNQIENDKQYSCLKLAIITESLKQRQFILTDKQAFVYLNHNSYKASKIIFQNQYATDWQQSLFVEQGGLLVVEVDQVAMKITFLNKRTNDRRVYPMGQQFRNRNLYLSVTMLYKGESVEILQ